MLPCQILDRVILNRLQKQQVIVHRFRQARIAQESIQIF